MCLFTTILLLGVLLGTKIHSSSPPVFSHVQENRPKLSPHSAVCLIFLTSLHFFAFSSVLSPAFESSPRVFNNIKTHFSLVPPTPRKTHFYYTPEMLIILKISSFLPPREPSRALAEFSPNPKSFPTPPRSQPSLVRPQNRNYHV